MRTLSERQADARTRLQTDRDAWIATAGTGDGPHLVPVSLCWHRERILLATGERRPLARDLLATGRARLGLGDGVDVVLIEAAAEVVGWATAAPSERSAFTERVGWDPGQEPGSWVLLRLAPRRMRVWRTVEENRRGSLVMRDGKWL